MRVLWLSPWMRSLARVQVSALRDLGVQTMLITSDQHPEKGPALDGEITLVPRVKVPGSWVPFARTLWQARAFAPDVVVAELVRDPRWLAFGRLAPVVQVVHDDVPHDASERRPAWARALFDRWAAGSAATVVFSDYVRDQLSVGVAAATDPALVVQHGVHVVPLTSDLPDAAVPPLVPADQRRDLVVVGRINPYKNLAVTFAAWERHVTGPAYRGDDLVVIGQGSLPRPLPSRARWESAPFAYADTVPVLARAKASVVHYRRASQSGAQVLAMQLGVVPIASDRGALQEFQPPGDTPLGVDDVTGLAAAFDRIADPQVAWARGRAAQEHYRQRFSADQAAARWLDVLSAVTSR